MMTGLAAVVRRSFARLVGDRVVLGVAAMLVLVTVFDALMFGYRADGNPREAAQALRVFAWGEGGFTATLTIVALVLGLTAIGGDVRRGTIFAVLARPVSRDAVYVGSWLAVFAALCAAELVRAFLMSIYYVGHGGTADWGLLVGLAGRLAGFGLELALAAGLAAALPVSIALVLYIGINIVQVLAFARIEASWLWLARIPAALLPVAGKGSDVIRGLLIGQSRDVAAGVEAVAYRVCWTLLLLVAGAWLFRRRDLAPRA